MPAWPTVYSTPFASDGPSPAVYPLFPVATHKFIALSICTLGIYELYWGYQNWKRIQAMTGEQMHPFWRAFWFPLWNFSLFKRFDSLAVSNDVEGVSAPQLLAGLYLVFSMLWRLPVPWVLLGFLSFLPLIPVQMAVSRINSRYAGLVSENPNNRYSLLNIITIILGGLLTILVIVGSLMPQTTPTA